MLKPSAPGAFALLGFCAGLTLIVAVPQAAGSPAEVTSWKSPEPGWLYVLDPELDAYSHRPNKTSQVLLIDPASGEIEGAVKAGCQPDFALSPDGRRLYIFSTDILSNTQMQDDLSVIDTQSGVVVGNWPVNDRIGIIDGLPDLGTFVAGPEGQYLYMLKVHSDPMARDGHGWAVATFDVHRGGFLPDEAQIPDCDAAQIIPLPAPMKVVTLCPETDDLRIVQIGPGGIALAISQVQLASAPVVGALRADGRTLAVLDDHNRFLPIDTRSVKLTDAALGNVTVPPGKTLETRSLPVFAGGRRLYAGYAGRGGDGYSRSDDGYWSSSLSTAVVSFNLETGQTLVSAPTSEPFLNLSLGRDGQQLYAVSPSSKSIMVLDASSLKELRKINNVGVTPASTLVAP